MDAARHPSASYVFDAACSLRREGFSVLLICLRRLVCVRCHDLDVAVLLDRVLARCQEIFPHASVSSVPISVARYNCGPLFSGVSSPAKQPAG